MKPKNQQPRLFFVTPEEFKNQARKQKSGTENGDVSDETLIVVKSFPATIKSIDIEKRTIDFIISDGSIDRHDDTISPAGWVLDNYKKNPVVLWAHQNKQLPIAKSIAIDIDSDGLKSTAEFATRDVYPFADSVFQMYQKGFLNAVSVGFNAIEWEWAEDEEERPMGIDFLKQELFEYSAVPIPANPNALIDAKSKGVDIAPLADWAEQCIEELAQICGKSLISVRELKHLQKIATISGTRPTGNYVPMADYLHLQRSLQIANLKLSKQMN